MDLPEQMELPRLRRSILFMPADDARKIEKAASLPTDAFIADLEDAVALNRKEAARRTVVEAFRSIDFGNRERLIRLNAPGSRFHAEDLQATLAARPDGYVLPKVESADQIRAVSKVLAVEEEEQGWPPGSIRLLAMIESARGVLHLDEIARADKRLVALMLGGEDLAGDMGATRTREGWEIFYARGALVTATAAYGLQAVDTVYVDLNDLETLAQECHFVRRMGYRGKMAIHPRQTPVFNELFSPTAEEVAAAQRLIDAFNAEQAAGRGVFELDGKMVDMPMLRSAQRVVAEAKAVQGSEE
jgi:citrate lyase beta subunit